MLKNEKGFAHVLVIVLAVVIIGSTGVAVAANNSLPGDALYGIGRAIENAQMRIAFGDDAKAARQVDYAEKRFEELTTIANDNAKIENIDIALEQYERGLEDALARTETARSNGVNVDDVLERLTEAQLRQAATLQEVHERVPDEAKEAIARAQEASVRGFERSAEAVGAERATEIQNRVRGEKPNIDDLLRGVPEGFPVNQSRPE